jgi:UDP-N-acetylmuramyl pentapeptide phosphotransferase/UDP-N-acetylglucosamine-1-phosphate transferase
MAATIGGGILLAAAAMSGILILLLRGILQRYALARPNARSSHHVPTPQGGGIAVIVAALATTAAFLLLQGGGIPSDLWRIFAAAAFLAAVGAVDDIRIIPVAPRLILQSVAIAAVVASLPADLRIVPGLPEWAERALLLIGGVWFVNLVNFMDGIDWMTAVEVVTISLGVILIGVVGGLPVYVIVLAIALCGAALGFAPFNRPVARLFLGDVGSLPIGLLLGWLLLMVARQGYLAASVLLPLYYLADATITLARRLGNGETIWKAHRKHFYQRALDRGFTVLQIVGRVFAVNLVLVALALVTVIIPQMSVIVSALALGALLVAWLLVSFDRGP